MGKVILVHANCHHPTAKGDFVFAGNIAKDMIAELQRQEITDIDVVLVSMLDGVPRFKNIYGPVIDGRVSIEGTSVGLSSLEEFDAVENTVVAFIDANRCKRSTADLVKHVLAPDSRVLFVGNLNQNAFSSLFLKTLYRRQAMREQPEVYESFNEADLLVGSAGFGADRLGLPTLTKAEDLPPLSSSEQAVLPTGSYGFSYLTSEDPEKDYKLIAQYFKLSGQDKQVLVGDLRNEQDIQYAYEHDMTLDTSQPLPEIQYYQSLPNRVMRQAVANAAPLVLSTGVTSTLESMREGKLPYYQTMPNNAEFVAAYLLAVKSIVSEDTILIGAMPGMIIELSSLLFADKPLTRKDMTRTHNLLEMSSTRSRLISTNQTIIDQASGTIARKLLSFLGDERKTEPSVQLATVCASLRKSSEMGTPVHDQALRRAAAWGRLFELKVLMKSMSMLEMNKVDPTYGRTALHWAVLSGNFDCARTLVKAGVDLDLQDKEGQTALHKAVKNGSRPMIKMLIEAGASVEITDHTEKSPADCATDSGILLFIGDCHTQICSSALNRS